jgi:hypothetical protein
MALIAQISDLSSAPATSFEGQSSYQGPGVLHAYRLDHTGNGAGSCRRSATKGRKVLLVPLRPPPGSVTKAGWRNFTAQNGCPTDQCDGSRRLRRRGIHAFAETESRRGSAGFGPILNTCMGWALGWTRKWVACVEGYRAQPAILLVAKFKRSNSFKIPNHDPTERQRVSSKQIACTRNLVFTETLLEIAWQTTSCIEVTGDKLRPVKLRGQTRIQDTPSWTLFFLQQDTNQRTVELTA